MSGAEGGGIEKSAVSPLGKGGGQGCREGGRPPCLEGQTGAVHYEKAVSLLDNAKPTGSTAHGFAQ